MKACYIFGVPKNFSNFTGKYIRWSVTAPKAASALRGKTFLLIRFWKFTWKNHSDRTFCVVYFFWLKSYQVNLLIPIWLLNHSVIYLALCCFATWFLHGSILIYAVISNSQRKQRQVRITLFITVKALRTNRIYLILITPRLKIFWRTLTGLTIITAQYVYFHSQKSSVSSYFTIGRCPRATVKKRRSVKIKIGVYKTDALT